MKPTCDMYNMFSPTWPSGPSWSSSRDFCLFICPLFIFFMPLIGPQVTWSDPGLHDAVRHDGISTLKMKRNVHHYDDQIPAITKLSVTMASVLWKWKEMYISTMIRSRPSRRCPSRWYQYSKIKKKCTSLQWSDPGLFDQGSRKFYIGWELTKNGCHVRSIKKIIYLKFSN